MADTNNNDSVVPGIGQIQVSLDARREQLTMLINDRVARLFLENHNPYIRAPLTYAYEQPHGSLSHRPRSGGDPFPEGGGDGDEPPIDPEEFNLDYIGGLDDVVKYLRRHVVIPWMNSSRSHELTGFHSQIIQPVKGMIFYGPPGTGKTLMGKCLAGELQRSSRFGRITFIFRKGTDTFSKWVGESERTLREIFAKATIRKPAVIFFDEIDGLLPARREGQHEHAVSVTTTFLGLVDQVKRGEVFIIGATNRLDSLDPAVLRPGRFDKHIRFTPPNEAGRFHILNKNLDKWGKNKPNQDSIRSIAARTAGFTGADLEQLIRNAVECAVSREIPDLGSTFDGLEAASDKLNALTVKTEDWIKALGSMSSTNVNVFGSTMYTGTQLQSPRNLLLGNMVQEIKVNVDRLVNLCLIGNNLTSGFKSFLLFGASNSAVDALDTHVIPAVMGSFDSAKVKGFKTSFTENACKAIAKASTAAREMPSILYIQRIDLLWTKLVANNDHHAFLLKLKETGDTNLIVLASASCPPSVFPTALQEIFQGKNRSMELRRPNNEEIKAFLGEIFHKSPVNSKFPKRVLDKHKMEEILKKAAAAASGDEISHVVAFHQALMSELLSWYPGTDRAHTLYEAFNGIIEEYKKNKLL